MFKCVLLRDQRVQRQCQVHRKSSSTVVQSLWAEKKTTCRLLARAQSETTRTGTLAALTHYDNGNMAGLASLQ